MRRKSVRYEKKAEANCASLCKKHPKIKEKIRTEAIGYNGIVISKATGKAPETPRVDSRIVGIKPCDIRIDIDKTGVDFNRTGIDFSTIRLECGKNLSMK